MTTQAAVISPLTGSCSIFASQSFPRQFVIESASKAEILRILFFISVSLLVSLQFAGLLGTVSKPAVIWILAPTLSLGIVLAPSSLKSWEFRWSVLGLLMLTVIVLATKGIFIVPLSVLLIPTPFSAVGDLGMILYDIGGLSIVVGSSIYGIKLVTTGFRTDQTLEGTRLNNAKGALTALRYVTAESHSAFVDSRSSDIYDSAKYLPKQILVNQYETAGNHDGQSSESEQDMQISSTSALNKGQSRGAVLVADDEKSLREGLRQALEEEGYTATTASDGVEALVLAAEQEFELAILDVNMPGLSGVQVLDLLKRISDTTVILMSGEASVQTAIDGMKLGAFDYVTKPFDLDALIIKVEEAFRSRKEMHEAKSQRQDLEEAVNEQQARLKQQFAETVQSLAREFSIAGADIKRSGDAARDFVNAIRRITQRGLGGQ